MGFCRAAVQRILLNNLYGVSGTSQTKLEVSVARMKSSMDKYYEDKGVARNRRITNLTLGMCGKACGFNTRVRPARRDACFGNSARPRVQQHAVTAESSESNCPPSCREHTGRHLNMPVCESTGTFRLE